MYMFVCRKRPSLVVFILPPFNSVHTIEKSGTRITPPAAAVQLPGNNNNDNDDDDDDDDDNDDDDDDDGGPISFANDRMAFTFEYLFGNLVGNLVTTGITPNPRIDVVHNAITGNADVGTETTVLPHDASNREQLPHDTSKQRYSYITVDAHSHKGGQ